MTSLGTSQNSTQIQAQIRQAQIRIDYLREKLIGTLTLIEAEYPSKAIDKAIRKLHVLKISDADTTEGFNDIHTKAMMMYIAATAISESYYHTLPKKLQLELHFLFRDSLEEERNTRGKRFKIPPLPYKIIEKFQRQTKSFLKAWHAGKVSPPENPVQEFEEKAADDLELTINVDMDQVERLVLEDEEALGTTDLGSCVAICISGENSEGQKIASVRHLTVINTQQILKDKARLAKEFNVPESSLSVCLTGGCIENMVAYLPVLKQAKALGIVDVRLCSDSSYLQTHEVSLREDAGYYAVRTDREDFIKDGSYLENFGKKACAELVRLITSRGTGSSSPVFRQEAREGKEEAKEAKPLAGTNRKRKFDDGIGEFSGKPPAARKLRFR